jgi:hypothetical protein
MLCAVQMQVIESRAAESGPRSRGPAMLAGAAAVVFGVFEGFVGFVCAAPGSSLATTCALVAALGLVGLGLGWAVLWRRGHRDGFRVFAVGTVALSIAAVWWTWAFALPAALQWDTSATPRAQTALRGIGDDKSVCTNVLSGSIGPLAAPYQQCAINGPPGSTVEYLVLSGDRPLSPYRGLIFSEAPESTFSDECTRHLVGDWYAFSGDPAGLIGYSCRGGG